MADIELTEWLKLQGWEVTEDANILRIKGTPSKLAEEADQLFKELQDNFGLIFDPTQKTEDDYAVSLRAYYDPSTGEAFIEVFAL